VDQIRVVYSVRQFRTVFKEQLSNSTLEILNIVVVVMFGNEPETVLGYQLS
jgi:hypothetical protein